MPSLWELYVAILGDNSGLKKTFNESEGILGKFARTADSIGGKLATSLGFAGLGAGALAAAKNFDDASVAIRNATGATGEKLKSLEASFANVYKQVDESSGQVSAALALLSTRTGASGKDLEGMTVKLLDLAKVQREGVGELTPLITRAFGDWSIATSKQSAAMDFLGVVSQQSGVKVARLSEQVVSAGAPLRALGYDFNSATTLIAKFEKEGVNTELVLGGMKAALQKFTKEGITDTAKAWKDFVADVQSGKISFKAVAEEVGAKRAVDLFKAIQEGRFEIEKATASYKEMAKEGVQTADTLSEKFKKLQHQLETLLAGHSELIMTVGFAWPALSTIGAGMLGVIKAAAASVGWGVIGGAIAVPVIIGAIGYFAGDWLQKKFGGPSGNQDLKKLNQRYGNFNTIDAAMAFTELSPDGRMESPPSAGRAGGGYTPDKNFKPQGPADQGEMLEVYIELLGRYHAALKKLTDQLADFYDNGTIPGEMLRSWELARKAVAAMLPQATYDVLYGLPNTFNKIKFAVDAAAAPMRALGDAFEFFGIQSVQSLEAIVESGRKNFEILKASGQATAQQLDVAFTKMKLRQIELDHLLGDTDDELYAAQKKNVEDTLKNIESDYGKNSKAIQKDRYSLARELDQLSHRTFDNIERGIARNIVEWNGWKDSIVNIGKSLAEDFLSIMLKGLLKPLEDVFARTAARIGGWLGGVLGVGGGAASAAGTAAGGAATAAGGAASAAGGAASAVGGAASSLTGIVGAVGSVVTAVSSVIGNFQTSETNVTLDRIVDHTLQTANDLKNLRADQWSQYNHIYERLGEMWRTEQGIADAISRMKGSAGGTTNWNFQGASFGAGVTQQSIQEWFSAAWQTQLAANGA